MTLITPVYTFPYPEGGDDADGPQAFHDLAVAVENALDGASRQCVVLAEETRTSISYGLMANHDEVLGFAVPDAGQVCVAFSAHWKGSAAGVLPQAAIFIGTNQLRFPDGPGEVYNPQFAQLSEGTAGNAPYYRPITTFPGGLVSGAGGGHSVDIGAFPTTGVALAASNTMGGVCVIERLPAGSYDFSVRWREPGGGSVTVKNRILTVWRTL